MGGPPISPSASRVGRSEDGDGSSELREAALAADGAIHRSNEVSNLSIATGETDRSALESKDRQQLATIARALGGKPTARTRKDELVEMILELADEGAGAPERDGDTMSDQTTEDAPATTDTNGSRDAGTRPSTPGATTPGPGRPSGPTATGTTRPAPVVAAGPGPSGPTRTTTERMTPRSRPRAATAATRTATAARRSPTTARAGPSAPATGAAAATAAATATGVTATRTAATRVAASATRTVATRAAVAVGTRAMTPSPATASGAVGAATRAESRKRRTFPSPTGTASPSTWPVCSTSATRATASCA